MIREDGPLHRQQPGRAAARAVERALRGARELHAERSLPCVSTPVLGEQPRKEERAVNRRVVSIARARGSGRPLQCNFFFFNRPRVLIFINFAGSWSEDENQGYAIVFLLWALAAFPRPSSCTG